MDEKPKMTRRGLLKATGATAATVAFPTIIPRSVWGANERIAVGVIGCGGMGTGHVAADTVALCDVDANHLANAAKRVTQGTPFLTKDYRALLDRMDVDAVIIATPDHWHAIQ